MPPRRATSSASSAVEISTPMPPTMIGTSSCFAQTQAEIIDALHCRLIRDLDSVTLSPVGARFCLHGAGKFFDPGP
jgi:hypothetical protein